MQTSRKFGPQAKASSSSAAPTKASSSSAKAPTAAKASSSSAKASAPTKASSSSAKAPAAAPTRKSENASSTGSHARGTYTAGASPASIALMKPKKKPDKVYHTQRPCGFREQESDTAAKSSAASFDKPLTKEMFASR